MRKIDYPPDLRSSLPRPCLYKVGAGVGRKTGEMTDCTAGNKSCSQPGDHKQPQPSATARIPHKHYSTLVSPNVA
jgi:hypothetical protein